MVKEVELGDKGRLVIPVEVRRTLNLQPGDKLLFVVEDDQVRLTTRRALVDSIYGAFAAPDGRCIVDEFLAERRAEAEAKGW